MQKDMQRLNSKAEAASKDAKDAASKTLEAIELSEESAERLHPRVVRARLNSGRIFSDECRRREIGGSPDD